MTEEQLDRKFNFLEDLLQKASTKDRPGLVAIYNKLMDRAVKRDMKKKSKPKRKPVKKEDPKKYRIFLGSGKHKDLTALGMLREVNKAKAYYAASLENYTLKNWQEGWWNLCEGGQVDEQGYQKEYLGYCQKAVNEYFTTLIKKERHESKT